MGGFLFYKTKLFEWREQKAVQKSFYAHEPFKKADKALLKAYRRKNPYLISKNYLLNEGEGEVYTYGETPLTTVDKIAKAAGLSPNDRVIEMGAGRGRAALFLAEYVGCQVRAYEKIPYFTQVLKKIPSSRLNVLQKDMTKADFSWASVIYLYGTMLLDPEILALIKRFPHHAKIITVSFPLNGYSTEYQTLTTLSGRFPWGETEVFINGRTC